MNTTDSSLRKCYDCGQPRHPGSPCVPLTEPAPGTSYRLERFHADPFLGSYRVAILAADGHSIAGLHTSRAECERFLKIRGFRGPFTWPTVEQTRAARKDRRSAKLTGGI